MKICNIITYIKRSEWVRGREINHTMGVVSRKWLKNIVLIYWNYEWKSFKKECGKYVSRLPPKPCLYNVFRFSLNLFSVDVLDYFTIFQNLYWLTVFKYLLIKSLYLTCIVQCMNLHRGLNSLSSNRKTFRKNPCFKMRIFWRPSRIDDVTTLSERMNTEE